MSLGVEFDVGVAHAGGAIGPLTDSGSGALTGDTVGLSGGIELGANGPGEIAASTLEGIGAHLSGEGEQPLLMGGERRLCVGRQPTGGSGHRIEVRATHTTSAERGLEEGHIGAEPSRSRVLRASRPEQPLLSMSVVTGESARPASCSWRTRRATRISRASSQVRTDRTAWSAPLTDSRSACSNDWLRRSATREAMSMFDSPAALLVEVWA